MADRERVARGMQQRGCGLWGCMGFHDGVRGSGAAEEEDEGGRCWAFAGVHAQGRCRACYKYIHQMPDIQDHSLSDCSFLLGKPKFTRNPHFTTFEVHNLGSVTLEFAYFVRSIFLLHSRMSVLRVPASAVGFIDLCQETFAWGWGVGKILAWKILGVDERLKSIIEAYHQKAEAEMAELRDEISWLKQRLQQVIKLINAQGHVSPESFLHSAQVEDLAVQGSYASLRELAIKAKILVYYLIPDVVSAVDKTRSLADQMKNSKPPFPLVLTYLVAEGPYSHAGQSFRAMLKELQLEVYDLAVLYDLDPADCQRLFVDFGKELG